MKFVFSIFFILIVQLLFAQDLIVLNDSTKIKAKIIEVKQTEVKYKLFEYQDGPDITRLKTEIAYITYQNGVTEVIAKVPEKIIAQKEEVNFEKIKEKKPTKVGDYIKVSIELGAVANESFCNVPYDKYNRLGSLGSPHDEFFSQPGKKYTTLGASTGINVLFGRSPYCKHLLGINYTNSKGEFNIEESSFSYDYLTASYTSYEKVVNYKSRVHYLNITTGPRFIILKKFCLDNTFSVNIPFYAVNKVNGYETTIKGDYNHRYPTTTYFNNKTTHDYKVGVTVSFTPKLTYEFYDFNRKVGVYFAYNFSYKYNLPWYMFGVTIYPFKKLQ